MSIVRDKVFSVKGNSYTIKFPTVGEFFDIESRRIQLSSGTYHQMLRSTLVSAQTALDLIDMVSTISVMVPKLQEDIKAKTLIDLDLIDSLELLKVYREDISPFIESWMKLVRSGGTEEKSEETTS